MKCLDDCHTYEMDTFMGTGTMQGGVCRNCGTDVESVIGFYRMDPDGSKLDGVTNEEVIRVLIHRMKVLNGDGDPILLEPKWRYIPRPGKPNDFIAKFRCRENSIVITKLEEALMWLEKRTRDREALKVEGTHEP
jgi:hypothetical protein